MVREVLPRIRKWENSEPIPRWLRWGSVNPRTRSCILPIFFFSCSIPTWRNTRICIVSDPEAIFSFILYLPCVGQLECYGIFPILCGQASAFFSLFFNPFDELILTQWKLLVVGRFQLVSMRKPDKLAITCVCISQACADWVSIFPLSPWYRNTGYSQ